jgi:hypothetical protein
VSKARWDACTCLILVYLTRSKKRKEKREHFGASRRSLSANHNLAISSRFSSAFRRTPSAARTGSGIRTLPSPLVSILSKPLALKPCPLPGFTKYSFSRPSSFAASLLKNMLLRLASPRHLVPAHRFYATAAAAASSSTPQTLIEKIVQKYAVGAGKTKVKSGDYVMVGPEHV